jgi:hypothetical protein
LVLCDFFFLWSFLATFFFVELFQGTKVKKESCDKEMQKSHDMEMKEESCDTEIKVESGNDDTIFKYDCPVCEKKCKTPNGSLMITEGPFSF